MAQWNRYLGMARPEEAGTGRYRSAVGVGVGHGHNRIAWSVEHRSILRCVLIVGAEACASTVTSRNTSVHTPRTRTARVTTLGSIKRRSQVVFAGKRGGSSPLSSTVLTFTFDAISAVSSDLSSKSARWASIRKRTRGDGTACYSVLHLGRRPADIAAIRQPRRRRGIPRRGQSTRRPARHGHARPDTAARRQSAAGEMDRHLGQAARA